MACVDCGKTGEIHQHHVVPRSLGGIFTVPLCSDCHALVHGLKKLSVGRLTKAAMQHKIANNEYTGGPVRYGYKVASCGVKLIEDEAEQLVIAAVVEYRAAGLSLRKISAELASRGVVNRSGKAFAHNAISKLVAWSKR